MKKILFSMLAAVTLLASCQKSDLDGISSDGMVDVTLSASLSEASATTRTATTTVGDGKTANRCILEVYIKDGDLYKRMVAPVEDLETLFELRLVSSQEYEFLLWADKSLNDTVNEESGDGVVGGGDKHYITTNADGLKGITTSYENYLGNDETRDAFYYAETKEITASTVIKAELKRPFGQVNVKTYLEDVPSTMYPASVLVTYTTKVCNTFNVLDGKLSGDETAIEWKSTADGKSIMEDNSTDATPYIDLSTDYLFASADEQDLHNFTMTFYDDAGTEITYNDNFKSIPVQRNYQTNVSGELLTKQGTVNVEIKPAFEDLDNNVTIKEVASIAELKEEMSYDSASAEASYAIADQVVANSSNDDDGDNTATTITITIPSLTGDVASTTSTETTSRSIDLTSGIASDVTLTITTADTATAATDPDVVYITIPDDENQTLIINLPNSSVYINGTYYGLNAATYSNTLVIQEGAVVDGLTINAGNVKVYGTLKGAVTLGAGNTSATITVYSATGSIDSEAVVDEDITIVNINLDADIVNLDTGVAYESVFEAVVDAGEYETIRLKEGTYNYLPGVLNVAVADGGFKWTLPITKNGLTIRGVGEVILAGEITDEIIGSSSMDYTVSPIMIKAKDVTFDNLTIKAVPVRYAVDGWYVNKTIELTQGYNTMSTNTDISSFTMSNCKLIPHETFPTNGGCLYLDGSTSGADGILIEDCEFENTAISVRPSTIVEIKNTTFDGIRDYDGWDTCVGVRGEATLSICEFTNIAPVCDLDEGSYGTRINAPIKGQGSGVIKVENSIFPTDETYWYADDLSTIYIDDVKYTAPVVNTTQGTGFQTIQDAVDDAEDGDVIYVYPGEYTTQYSETSTTAKADDTLPTYNYKYGYKSVNTDGNATQFNLFIYKSISIYGVDSDGNIIDDVDDVQMTYTAGHPHGGPGTSTVYIWSPNVTIQGIKFVGCSHSPNKTVEIQANNATIKHCIVDAVGGGGVYVSRSQYAEDPNDYFNITDNLLLNGVTTFANCGLTDGIAYTNRNFTSNTIDMEGVTSGVSMTGNMIIEQSVTGINWYNTSVGAINIKDNTFTNIETGASLIYVRAVASDTVTLSNDVEGFLTTNTYEDATVKYEETVVEYTSSYTTGNTFDATHKVIIAE